MEKPFDYIFIDTSVFQSESFFKKSGGVSRLFNLSEKGWIRILLPEIAKREWFKHFKQFTSLKFTEVEKKATLMGNTKDVDVFVEAHNGLVSSYDSLVEKTFNEHLKRANVIILPISFTCDTLASVVDKYFKQEKPFGGKGKEKEFPDAFILASLEKYAKENTIEHIQLFSLDNDMNKYNSSIFVKQETGPYLNDFITKRIPEHEAEEKRKRDEKDISRLMHYMQHNFENFKPQIYTHVEQFLSDVSLYSERFNYADIEEAYVEKLELDGSIKDMEIMAVEEDIIRALYFVDVDAVVKVNHFCEEDSVWDSEDKKYMFESYSDTNLEISSSLKVELEMDRTELEMGQNPDVQIIEIDTDDLQDSIDEEPREYKHKVSNANVAGWMTGYPSQSIAQAVAAAQKVTTPMSAAMSSITAMSAAIQQMQMPDAVKGLQQMSLINPSLAETTKSIQKIQDSIPKSAIGSICELAVKGSLGTTEENKK